MASKHPTIKVASLAVASALTVGGAVHLLPIGDFAAVDGRPADVKSGKWHLGPEQAAALIQRASEQVNPFLIDYEHQSLLKADNGKPAPAAGWFKQLEMRADGLWAVGVEWTARAKELISAGEYKFASAVFAYDETTGDVLKLFSAAITNTPGLDGLSELSSVAAASLDFSGLSIKQEQTLNPLLVALLKALNLPDNTSEATALTAVATLTATADSAKQSIAALTAQVATAKDAPDPAKFVPIAAFTEVNAKLAKLTAQAALTEVDRLVDEGVKAGKISPALKDWAVGLGKGNAAALSAFLKDAPVIVDLSGRSQAGAAGAAGAGAGVAALTAEEREVCTALGLTDEAFIKSREEQKAGR